MSISKHDTSLGRCIDSIIQSEGHTWVPYTVLSKKNSCRDLRQLIKDGKISWENVDGRDFFTLPSYKSKEEAIALRIAKLLTRDDEKIPSEVINRFIREKDVNNTLDPVQKQAVHMAVNSPIMVLTGGPGTGKTFTLNMISYVLEKCFPNKTIEYAAPTGKASKRMTESTGHTARTLHKVLGLNFYNKRSEHVSASALVIDESSMIDADLCSSLFTAVQPTTKLIFVGDVDQLPSVGPGAVLRDLILSGWVPTTKLTKTFRQKGESLILDNMKNIRDGICKMDVGNDFIITRPSEVRMKPEEWLVGSYIHKAAQYGIDNTALLTPYRQIKFETGAEHMNNVIQSRINFSQKSIAGKNVRFKLGDRVIQLENRPECANGDIGTVVDVGQYGLTVEYTEDTVNYAVKELGQIALAYALSVHKSQGSEYKAVVSCMLNEHQMMLQRNLLYTAVTRAKQDFVLFAEDDAVRTAIQTEASGKRVTMLQRKIQQACSAVCGKENRWNQK